MRLLLRQNGAHFQNRLNWEKFIFIIFQMSCRYLKSTKWNWSYAPLRSSFLGHQVNFILLVSGDSVGIKVTTKNDIFFQHFCTICYRSYFPGTQTNVSIANLDSLLTFSTCSTNPFVLFFQSNQNKSVTLIAR